MKTISFLLILAVCLLTHIENVFPMPKTNSGSKQSVLSGSEGNSGSTGAVTSVTSVPSGAYEGPATWFKPDPEEGGSEGACGGLLTKTKGYVAISGQLYGDTSKISKYCGKIVQIYYKSKEGTFMLTGEIRDACPGCSKYALDIDYLVYPQLFTDHGGDDGDNQMSWVFADGTKV